MRKQTTKFFAVLLSLLTLLSMVTFSNGTVFAAEKYNAQKSVTSKITNFENVKDDSDLATGDTTFEESAVKDSATVLKSPSEYYNYLSKNGGKFNKKLRATNAYPSSVDNSTSEYFPEVRSQESIGSCTAWAQTYYQFTYTMNKQLGRKTTLQNTFSPKWTYNFAARGEDKGSADIIIYGLMKNIGAATWASVPYDDDYLTWSPVESIWKEASNYRLKSYSFLSYGNGSTPITGANDSDLNTIKAALSNGELLTYSTYFRSWNYKTIENDSRVEANKEFAGQDIVINAIGSKGPHRMTIVGYNDNIWVDINENGIVEDNEMGAFKVVNSHGKDYRNDGFAWVAYDALNRVSSVDNGDNSAGRKPIFEEIARIDVEPYNSDSNIYLRYTLNSAARQETPLYVVAEKDNEYTEITVDPYEITEISNFSYDGTQNSKDGTMIFDLSRVIPNITSSQFKEYNWSVKFKDKNADGNTLTVKNVEIVDENSGDIYRPSASVPFTLNGSERTVKLYPNDNNITIYYKGYDTPYIHYQVGNGSWSSVPGYAMPAVNEIRGYTHKYTIHLGAENYANVCFNDGHGNWDSRNGANYRFEAGTYTYSNGQINEYINERDLSIKSFDITPSDGKVKVGENVNMKVNLEHSTGTTRCQYAYRDSDGKETIIYDYSSALMWSEKFTEPGTYTLIVRVKDDAYDPSVLLTAERTVVVTEENVLRIKSFNITPSDGKIKVGEYVRMNITFENPTWMAETQYSYIDSEGKETIIYPYSTASGGSVSFTKAGKYTLIAKVRHNSYDKSLLIAKKTVIVTDELTIYYRGYSTPYIHYQVGDGEWTSVPGHAMDATNQVSGYTHQYKIELDAENATVCFNDGNDHWDNNNGANYKFEAGTYTFSNGKISEYVDDGSLKIKSFDITPANGIIKTDEYISMHVELENSESVAMCEYAYRDSKGQETIIHNYSTASGCSENFSTPGIYTLIVRVKSNPYDSNTIYMEKTITVVDKDEPDDEVTIYYKGYSTPYIHYQIGVGEWTDVPGFEMTKTNEINGYTHKYTIHLNDATYANVCFNDSNGNWDSRNGENYKFYAGTYTYSNGKISRYFDDGSLKIKAFNITPSDGKIKAGDSVIIKLELKNATGSEVFRYSCVNSSGQEYVIHDYSGATGCSNQFNTPGTYTLIVKAKSGYYATDEIYAKKTIIVS